MSSVASLPTQWRALAGTLRAHAAEGAALAYEQAADELDAALRVQADELLTLEEASAESGFTVDHLSREVRSARIPNAGRKGAPRIRRADLPRKVGTLPPSPVVGHIDRDAIARAVITRHVGGAR